MGHDAPRATWQPAEPFKSERDRRAEASVASDRMSQHRFQKTSNCHARAKHRPFPRFGGVFWKGNQRDSSHFGGPPYFDTCPIWDVRNSRFVSQRGNVVAEKTSLSVIPKSAIPYDCISHARIILVSLRHAMSRGNHASDCEHACGVLMSL